MMCPCVHAEDLQELQEKEKEQSIEPDWEVDALLKAAAREGKRESIMTDLIIKLLGLDVIACMQAHRPESHPTSVMLG